MKKKLFLSFALLASLLLGGCGKTETAAEIMSKVQANQQKNEAVQTYKMDGKIKMAAEGMTLDFPIIMTIQSQPADKHGEPVLYFDLSLSFMGQSMNMKSCVQDQMLYTESDGERSREPIDYNPESVAELQQEMDLKKLYSVFTVKKTDNGYDLNFEAKDYGELAELISLLGNAETDVEALEQMKEQFQTLEETTTLEQCKVNFQISKNYQMTGGVILIETSAVAEGMTMNLSFELNLTVSTDLPMTEMDLSNWVI